MSPNLQPIWPPCLTTRSSRSALSNNATPISTSLTGTCAKRLEEKVPTWSLITMGFGLLGDKGRSTILTCWIMRQPRAHGRLLTLFSGMATKGEPLPTGSNKVELMRDEISEENLHHKSKALRYLLPFSREVRIPRSILIGKQSVNNYLIIVDMMMNKNSN